MRRRQKVFQREEFMKGGNPTVTQLLNLADVRDDSAKADAEKGYFELHRQCNNEYNRM